MNGLIKTSIATSTFVPMAVVREATCMRDMAVRVLSSLVFGCSG